MDKLPEVFGILASNVARAPRIAQPSVTDLLQAVDEKLERLAQTIGAREEYLKTREKSTEKRDSRHDPLAVAAAERGQDDAENQRS